MDRNFFLPIAIATTIHSFLFMTGRPPAEPERPIVEKRTVPPIETVEFDLDLPKPEENSVSEPQKHPPLPGIKELLTSAADAAEAITIPALPTPDLPAGPEITSIPTDWTGHSSTTGPGPNGLWPGWALDNAPAARFQPSPAYPADLKPLSMEGKVTVMFSVDVSGKVFNESVVEASHSRFGDEALRAVRRWRFEPGMKDGKRVAFRMVQSFTFDLAE